MIYPESMHLNAPTTRLLSSVSGSSELLCVLSRYPKNRAVCPYATANYRPMRQQLLAGDRNM